MKRTIKTITSAVLTAIMAAGIAGCSEEKPKDPGKEGFKPSLDTNAAYTMNVVGHYSNFETLEEEFNRFTEYYPNARLTYTALDNYSKSSSGILSTALAGSEPPDIFFTYPWIYDWPDGGKIAEASEDLSDPALGIDLSCIRDNLLVRDDDGRILSVPIYTTTYGMLVNENIFEKEGLSVPQTYSQLVSVCKALQDKGYTYPIMGYNKGTGLLDPLFVPYFCAQIQTDKKALSDLNEMRQGAGEYLRSALELAADFMSYGFIDPEECSKLENNYEAVILRFFEGDVPMMFATGNTVSGTKKRESMSEAFTAAPFSYSFFPVPSTEDGGYFLNSVSLSFSVNRNSKNLAVSNEFMRFLICSDELNSMANGKRMVPPCKDMSLNSVYAPFMDIDAGRTINQSELGLLDTPSSQVAKAGWLVSNGIMTVDEVIKDFGSLSTE
ncbi:MAG TPA: hypothetical protein DDX72_10005 [Ruminococcaceae bacterium]|nr:hypothetical protein [Oscillospiraceae bacterium]